MNLRTDRPGFASRPGKAETWVKAGDAPSPCSESAVPRSARLTVDITTALRARIKITAFQRGVTVAEMLRDLLVREFPPTDGEGE